jgi:hypothetical protein
MDETRRGALKLVTSQPPAAYRLQRLNDSGNGVPFATSTGFSDIFSPIWTATTDHAADARSQFGK